MMDERGCEMQNLDDFVAERRRQRELNRKRIKKYLYVFLLLAIIVVLVFIKKQLEYKVNFNSVKFDENKVTTVNFVDDVRMFEEVDRIMTGRYYIQADMTGNKKYILDFSNKLASEGIENYLVTDGKVVRLNILKSFDTIEDAEKYADKLKEKKLMDNYIIRVR